MGNGITLLDKDHYPSREFPSGTFLKDFVRRVKKRPIVALPEMLSLILSDMSILSMTTRSLVSLQRKMPRK